MNGRMHELVEAARHGDREPVEALVRAAWPDAYRLAYAMLADRSAAEDAAQEACIALARHIGSLRSDKAFRTWFARIVVREASAMRKRRPAVDEQSADEQRIEPHDCARTLDIWRALATLSPAMRTVVVLRYFEDLSSREIGAVLGIPSPTVRFRLMVALRRLRPLLETLSEPLQATPAPEVPSHAC